MRTYIVTSEKFTGEIEFRYNDIFQLCGYDNRADFEAVQHDWLLKNLPMSPACLHKVASIMKGKAIEVKTELTFEQFWKSYFAGRTKDNSSRKRAEAKWNRMSKGEQAKAWGYINTYMSNIAWGTAPKHAETYLNSELWN